MLKFFIKNILYVLALNTLVLIGNVNAIADLWTIKAANNWVYLGKNAEIPIHSSEDIDEVRLIGMGRGGVSGGGLRITAEDGTEYLVGANGVYTYELETKPQGYGFQSLLSGTNELFIETKNIKKTAKQTISFVSFSPSFWGELDTQYEGTGMLYYPNLTKKPLAFSYGDAACRNTPLGTNNIFCSGFFSFYTYEQETRLDVKSFLLTDALRNSSVRCIPVWALGPTASTPDFSLQNNNYSPAIQIKNPAIEPPFNDPRWKVSPDCVTLYWSVGTTAPISIYQGRQGDFFDISGIENINVKHIPNYISPGKALKSMGMVGWCDYFDDSLVMLSTTGAPNFFRQTINLDKSHYEYFWDPEREMYIGSVEDCFLIDSDFNDIMIAVKVGPKNYPFSGTLDSVSPNSVQQGTTDKIIISGTASNSLPNSNEKVNLVVKDSSGQVKASLGLTKSQIIGGKWSASLDVNDTAIWDLGTYTVEGNIEDRGLSKELVGSPKNFEIISSIPQGGIDVTISAKATVKPAYRAWFEDSAPVEIPIHISQ